MRVPLTLVALLLAAPMLNAGALDAAVAPLPAPSPEDVCSIRPVPAACSDVPGEPGAEACAGALCGNVPFVVDESGDNMTGPLTMLADVVMTGDHGVSFPAGTLNANPDLRFGGQLVCLSGGVPSGCGDITSVGPGHGLLGGGLSGDVALAINPALVQNRVTGTCAGGTLMVAVNQDGSVTCASAGAGDITSVSVVPGSGLTGGGATGDVALGIDPTVLQRRVSGVCAPGNYLRLVQQDGTVACAPDEDTTYTAGTGLTLTGTTFAVNPAAVQTRVLGTCAAGQYVRSIAQNGTVTCGTDTNSGGTVTSVAGGFGLAGGPITGTGTLSVNTSQVQQRVTGSCAAGQYVRSIAQTGSVTCGTDADSGGTVTSVATGFGLLGGPISSTGTLSVNNATIQQRVTGTCAAGSSIRSIAQNGAVTCETDDGLTYTNGTGLVLTGTTFSADTNFLQRRVTGSCAVGTYLRAVASDGTVTCGTDANSGGTVTSVASGAGLTGGPITGSGTLSIATGGVATSMLADNAVDGAKVKDFSLTANDLQNATVTSLKIADGTLTTNDLSFDPATQTELDAHKTSGDHDSRYALDSHGHDVASAGGTNTVQLDSIGTPASIDSVAVNVADECAGAENHRYLVQGGFTGSSPFVSSALVSMGLSLDPSAIPNDESFRYQIFESDGRYHSVFTVKLFTSIQPGSHTFHLLGKTAADHAHVIRHNLVVQHLGWTCT